MDILFLMQFSYLTNIIDSHKRSHGQWKGGKGARFS